MSDLLKISMAIDNDDVFMRRLETACTLESVEPTRHLLVNVAKLCAHRITLTPEGLIDTSQVTDEDIMTGVRSSAATVTIEGVEENE